MGGKNSKGKCTSKESSTKALDKMALQPVDVPIGSVVKTLYGTGTVAQFRTSDCMYVVVISKDSWVLAYDNEITCYLQAHDLTVLSSPAKTEQVEVVVEAELSTTNKDAKFIKGETVLTIYGVGEVLEVRKNDYVVRLRKWKLAYDSLPTLFLAEDALKKEPKLQSEIRGGDECISAYGRGICLSNLDNKLIIESDKNTWELAYGQLPRFFMPETECKKVIETTYGIASVEKVENEDKVKCVPVGWKLAYEQRPTYFLNMESVRC
ncbi:hypothetical protein ScalyP_jg2595 [Parmales sp. scaly parma]|nr:hypothetical protein ScalyP_jg2595 [Parmales sp. scaly parma]